MRGRADMHRVCFSLCTRENSSLSYSFFQASVAATFFIYFFCNEPNSDGSLDTFVAEAVKASHGGVCALQDTKADWAANLLVEADHRHLHTAVACDDSVWCALLLVRCQVTHAICAPSRTHPNTRQRNKEVNEQALFAASFRLPVLESTRHVERRGHLLPSFSAHCVFVA